MGLNLRGRIMPASNATFLADLDGREVVYKPIAGEQPLWDFPDGTLADREVAAYLLSEITGWSVVPRTWLDDGPHGLGMVQEWQTVADDDPAVTVVRTGAVPERWLAVFEGVDHEERPVTLIHEDSVALRTMVIFDVLANNADRKGGHVLAVADGRRLGVDHGLTFHHEPKLRTVLWGWAGAELSSAERTVIEEVAGRVRGSFGATLTDHLTDTEIGALERRAEHLLAEGVLPAPGSGWPAIPWPPF